MNFIRYPFFFVNLIFMIFGLAIMSVGILLLTNYSLVEHMLDVVKTSNIGSGSNSDMMNNSESYNYNYRSDIPSVLQPSSSGPLRWLTRIRDPASYLLITFGAFYFTLSFIGYCGSIKDSRGIMAIYAVLLLIMSAFQIVGIVLYMKYKPDLKSEVVNAIKDQYKPEEGSRMSLFELIFDLIMINYKCCGVNNERDFKEGYYFQLEYGVRSIETSIDPRRKGRKRVGKPDPGQEESEIIVENMTVGIEGRVIIPPEQQQKQHIKNENETRLIPASCCKLNITSEEAGTVLRNVYRNREDKLQLLDYAIDKTCVTAPDETNAYVGEGDSHGCFDKIQGELMTYLRIGGIVVGLIQMCGLVFAVFIFRTAYYDWLG